MKSYFKPFVSQHRKDRNSSWKCTTSFIRRQNHNGEVVDRSWLPSGDRVMATSDHNMISSENSEISSEPTLKK